MAYEKPISIQQAIASVADDEYVLPAIQREFVWDTEQIEMLFDSLMRDYPISTFLFWKVKAENVTKFQFYRFLKNYHERDERHNHVATLSGHKDVIALLDGQQRLTSIYIGLKGSYASRLRYHRSSSDHAYPKKYLHLNLLRESEDITREYDFQFLTEEEAAVRDESQLWVPASKVLSFKEYEDASDWVNDTLEDFSADLDAPLDKEIKKTGRKRFCTLYRAICERETINFFLEQSEELDKVLQIFIRINQDGTPLSYSDLLLSIATAQWKTLDARKEIHSFVDRINDIGKGFNFNKDFVLKSCLVLADIKDVKFKVDNFSSDNMALIEEQWRDISNAIELAIQLTAHFGFDARTLTSTNAMVPIAYFIKMNGIGENILHAEAHAENRRKIKLWLIRALLKKVFGGQPDSLYPVYRKLISESPGDFPLPAIISHYSSSNKSLDFYEDDISALMEVPYGSAFAFMLLSLVYALNHDYEFHQDHIHPKKHFTHKRLEKLGIGTHEEREAYIERFNSLPNLQLLQATPNQEKSGSMLADWLTATQSDPGQLQQYKEIHCFPPEASLAFADFVDFYDARRELLMKKLSKILEAKVLQRVEDAAV